MSVSDDLKAFIAAHRAHGQLTGDATEPGLAGYQVWIACPCGVTFRQQVTEGDALVDLAELAPAELAGEHEAVQRRPVPGDGW